MIEFELFSEIEKYLNTYDFICKKTGVIQFQKEKNINKCFLGAFLNSEHKSNDEVIIDLIADCDIEMIKKLMSYFESKAPIQELLQKRLTELETLAGEDGLQKFLTAEKNPSFYQYLVSLMEKHGFETDADFYNYIGMSRQTFSKIRNQNNGISRENVLLMAVGLGLNYKEATEFLSRAGYAFRKDNRRDVIISYVMRNKQYDLNKMEEILYCFGEKALTDIY